MTPNLEAAYAQPHRRYHTRAHIEQCLALLDQVPDLTDTELAGLKEAAEAVRAKQADVQDL